MADGGGNETTGGAAFPMGEAMGQGNVSVYLLMCFKALHEAYPEPVDLTQIELPSDVRRFGEKFLQLLISHEFIVQTADHWILTLQGYNSVRSAAVNDLRVAAFLSNGLSAIDNFHPQEILLSFLRVHFEKRKAQPN